jgi:hypothetical protein
MEVTANKGALGSDAFLLSIMPPWPWLARHKVDIDHLCLGTWGASVFFPSVLNTVYAQIPFSPGGNSFVAQTQFGGSPTTPPSSVCLDTPQRRESVTTLYNNPPLANADGNSDGLDDNSGLYARWTILQSQGASSLARAGDLRKSYAGSPSIPSDIGYVERIIDLQCFWIDEDGCPACDADSSGFLSEQETWNDDDMPAAFSLIDSDGDCLIDPAYAQPGQPTDTDDEPNGDPKCPVLQYSEYPMVVQYDTAADTDCDGLVDGIEYAYGSDPTLADSDDDGTSDFVEMFQFTDPTDVDSDDDGLLDRPENNYIAAATPSLQCTNNWDDDGDDKVNDGCPQVDATTEPGAWCTDIVDNDSDLKINDGCPQVGALKETVALGQCSNNTDDDTADADGVVNDGCPQQGSLDEDGAACDNDTEDDGDSAGAINDGCPLVAVTAEGGATGEAGEAANLDDNCPTVANPDQLNSDGQRRDNGTKTTGLYASNPNQDKMGDACDEDDDDDGATDAYELSTDGGKVASDPLKIDSDGDRCMDGAEWRLGTNPNDNAVEPAWSNVQQVYYRGCHINTAIEEEHSYTDWDAEYDGVENDVEYDPDGDGIVCSTDKDSDNGTGTLAVAKVEIADSIEAFCYNTGLMNKDSDGDGCADWVEIHDLNGDRTVNVGDSLNLSGATKCRKAGLATSDPVAFRICDITCDGFINVGDDLSLAKNQCAAKPNTGGCPMCAPEN